uniref:Uncharacterized protein n=1 Tax=Arundo donax TaxID=35708 RepID=A0A0A8ZN77_ARUDO
MAIMVGSEVFIIDSYALPLGSYDMILGVQCLGSLGPILWDFTKKTMCFVREDKRILWTGIDRPSETSLHAISPVSDDLMADLLDEFHHIFF